MHVVQSAVEVRAKDACLFLVFQAASLLNVIGVVNLRLALEIMTITTASTRARLQAKKD